MLEGNKRLIRRARTDDIEVIYQIEKNSFPGLTAYSKRQLAYLILKANTSTLVETENSAMHGFIIITYRKGSQIGNIETIDVDPSFQKQGVGLRLLAAAENDMKERGRKLSQLEVSEGNQAAIKLYQKAGYTIKHKIAGYYQLEHHGSCNAIRMIKTLDAAH